MPHKSFISSLFPLILPLFPTVDLFEIRNSYPLPKMQIFIYKLLETETCAVKYVSQQMIPHVPSKHEHSFFILNQSP